MVFNSSPSIHYNSQTPRSSRNKKLILDLWKRLKSPKTNYTYTDSLSYSSESLNKLGEDNYNIPIMSREYLKHKPHKLDKFNFNVDDIPGYKEEYRMIKSATYHSNKNPKEFLSKSIPNLYGLDVSDDEPPFANNYSYGINYYVNIILGILYRIIYFLFFLFHFAWTRIKSLLCGMTYPLRYMLASGFSNAYGYMNGNAIRIGGDEDGTEHRHHAPTPQRIRRNRGAQNRQVESMVASTGSEGSDTEFRAEEDIASNLNKSVAAHNVRQQNLKKRIGSSSGSTRVRQSQRLRLTSHENVQPMVSATQYTQPPRFSHKKREDAARDAGISRGNLESYEFEGGDQLEQSHPQHTSHRFKPPVQSEHGRRMYSGSGGGTSSEFYLDSVKSGLCNIGTGLKDELIRKFQSAYGKYRKIRNYLGSYSPMGYNYQSDINDRNARQLGSSKRQQQAGFARDEGFDSDYYSGGYSDGMNRHFDTLKNLYRRRRHRHEGLTLCSFPCPFLLFFFLLPLLLGLLLKRFGYDNEYMMNNSTLKDYYSPIKNKFDNINDKIVQNIPNLPNVPGQIRNLTRLPSLIYNDTVGYIYDKGKWLKDVNVNPLSYYSKSEDGTPGIFQKGLDVLIKDLDSVKKKLEGLEKSYFSPPPDEDWWKRKDDDSDETSDRDVRVIIKETIDKGLRQIRNELDRAGGAGGPGTASKLGDKYYESLTHVLDDLKNKFKSFTERTQMQEEKVAEKIDTLREALFKIDKQGDAAVSPGGGGGGGNVKTLVSRVDILTRQLDDLTNQLKRAESDTVELSNFAQKCCSTRPSPTSTSLNEAVGGDINLLLSKIDLTDLDSRTKEKFIALLREHFASHNKLDELKESLHHNLEKINKELLGFKNNLMEEVKSISSSKQHMPATHDKKLTYEEKKVRQIVEEMLDTYSADQLGMPDYALESAGGSVISTRCSETYDSHSALIRLLGVPVWYKSNSPRIAIQPGTQPGQCWAFKGSTGYFVVQLAAAIYPTAFSIDHIPRALSPSGNIDTAPKDFSIWGLASEKDIEGTLLGRYRFEKTGRPLQLFLTQTQDVGPFHFIELKIENNWGNPNYTCLYRFRVHGKLANTSQLP